MVMKKTKVMLAPCPLCGRSAKLRSSWFLPALSPWKVQCSKCGTTGPYRITPGWAARAWNNRVPAEKVLASLARELAKQVSVVGPIIFGDLQGNPSHQQIIKLADLILKATEESAPERATPIEEKLWETHQHSKQI